MADFDSFNYDIKSRLPEWWKEDTFLRPINEYTQQLIAEILEALLTTMGLSQPLNCWLSIPEEYNWYHHYKTTDDMLQDESDSKLVKNAVATLFAHNKMHVSVPNTKRSCNAKIKLKLLGTEIDEEKGENIEEITIENDGQKIILHDITSVSTIEISTKDNEILVDGQSHDGFIDGEIKRIRPTIKNKYFLKPYIDEEEYIIITKEIDENNKKSFFLPKKEIKKNNVYQIIEVDEEEGLENYFNIKILNIIEEDDLSYECILSEEEIPSEELTNEELENYQDNITILKVDKETRNIVRYEDIDIEDENKKTEIILHSSKTVNFDLQVYLYKPTYTTEQNIRIATVSAFPIESISLYGYFCHPFNNKAGYKYLWTKKYTEESRTTYDRITRQYDCERFYIKVKFYGIGTELVKGFPQEFDATNMAFQPNPNLDKWGKIYNLPRRFYRTDITEEEEEFTFPKYYKYQIEQDYWYEERMANEYKYEQDSVNSLAIRDDEFNNIGVLDCIYPFMNDIWVYTETIDPNSDTIHKVQNKNEDSIPLCSAKQNDESLGVEWENPQSLVNNPISITLNPQTEKVKKQNNFSYQTKKLKCSFCLEEFKEETPKNIEITGLEIKLKTRSNIQSNTIKLGEDSCIFIPYPNPDPDSSDSYILERINIVPDNETWFNKKGYYTIGGENNLFLEKEITREQLFNGNDGKVEFELVFVNENDFLESQLYLENLSLNIYYEIIPPEYSVEVNFDKKEINLNKEETEIKMSINIENTGKIPIGERELTIILPNELEIKNEAFENYTFKLEVGEVCPPIEIVIGPTEEIKTGLYDILVIYEDKVISNEILIRGDASCQH